MTLDRSFPSCVLSVLRDSRGQGNLGVGKVRAVYLLGGDVREASVGLGSPSHPSLLHPSGATRPPPVLGCSPIWPSLKHSHFISPFSELPPSFQNPSGPLQPLSGSSTHQFLNLMRPSLALSSPQDDPSPATGQSSHSPSTPTGFLQARNGEGRAQSSWPSPLWEFPLPQGNPAVLRAAFPTDIKGASHMASKASASPASFLLHQAPDTRETEAGPRDPLLRPYLLPEQPRSKPRLQRARAGPGSTQASEPSQRRASRSRSQQEIN